MYVITFLPSSSFSFFLCSNTLSSDKRHSLFIKIWKTHGDTKWARKSQRYKNPCLVVTINFSRSGPSWFVHGGEVEKEGSRMVCASRLADLIFAATSSLLLVLQLILIYQLDSDFIPTSFKGAFLFFLTKFDFFIQFEHAWICGLLFRIKGAQLTAWVKVCDPSPPPIFQILMRRFFFIR